MKLLSAHGGYRASHSTNVCTPAAVFNSYMLYNLFFFFIINVLFNLLLVFKQVNCKINVNFPDIVRPAMVKPWMYVPN